MVSLSDYEERLLEMGYTYDDISELGSLIKNWGDPESEMGSHTAALSEFWDILDELGLEETADQIDEYYEESIGYWQNWFWYEKGIGVNWNDLAHHYYDLDTGRFQTNPYLQFISAAGQFAKL